MTGQVKKSKRCELRIQVAIVTVRSDEDGCFYAFSPHVDVIGDGEFESEAIEMFKEAFEIFAEGRLEKGNLEQHLTKRGFKASSFYDEGQGVEVLEFRPPETLYKRTPRAKAPRNYPPQQILSYLSIVKLTSGARECLKV